MEAIGIGCSNHRKTKFSRKSSNRGKLKNGAKLLKSWRSNTEFKTETESSADRDTTTTLREASTKTSGPPLKRVISFIYMPNMATNGPLSLNSSQEGNSFPI